MRISSILFARSGKELFFSIVSFLENMIQMWKRKRRGSAVIIPAPPWARSAANARPHPAARTASAADGHGNSSKRRTKRLHCGGAFCYVLCIRSYGITHKRSMKHNTCTCGRVQVFLYRVAGLGVEPNWRGLWGLYDARPSAHSDILPQTCCPGILKRQGRGRQYTRFKRGFWGKRPAV